MKNLNSYLQDGADHQARAVLVFLQDFNIEESWNKEFNVYDAEIEVARWENCREQGYVLSMYSKSGFSGRQLNIAFFEHRNSDNICAIKWVQRTVNAPTIDTAEFGDVYKDKYDTSFSVSYGEIKEMAEWIEKQLKDIWLKDN